MDHLPGISKSHPIPSAMLNYDGSGTLVGFVPRPIALQFEKDLEPTAEFRPSHFHPAKRHFMADWSQAPASVGHDEHIVTVGKRR